MVLWFQLQRPWGTPAVLILPIVAKIGKPIAKVCASYSVIFFNSLFPFTRNNCGDL